MFKTILQTVNQMHKLGVIHLGTDLIMKLKAQADFQPKKQFLRRFSRILKNFKRNPYSLMLFALDPEPLNPGNNESDLMSILHHMRS